MNIFAISGLLTGLTSFLLGIFTLLKSKNNIANKIWAIFCFSVAIWGFGGYKVALTETTLQGLFWWRVTYMGIILIPILFYHFVHLFLGLKNKITLYAFYLYGFSFLILEWTPWADLFFGPKNISLLFNSLHWVFPPTYLFVFFVLFWYFAVIYSHYQLFRVYKVSVGLKRTQIKYFFIGMIVAFIGGGTCFLPCFGVNLYPYLNLTVPLYPAVITYAIVRHRLMDIKMVLRQSFVYLLSVLAVAVPVSAVLYLTNEFFPKYTTYAGVAALVFSVSVFSPVRDYFYRVANKYFFSSLYDAREVISKMSDGLRSTLDVSEVYNFISGTLVGSFHAKAVAVLNYDIPKNEYVVQFNNGFAVRGRKIFPGNSDLQSRYIEQSKIIVVEELRDELYAGHKEVFDMLALLGVAVIMPLKAKNEVLGIITLGEKESGDMYNDEDLRTLETISSQVAMAIKNAQLYDETKKFSVTLQAEVERQTAQLKLANEELQQLDRAKSDFISIASHQLRTPLTAIKGFSSMVLEGSYGKVSAKVGDKIEKIFNSADRLIRLVNDLLDLSHMESGKMEFKFAKLDFDAMVKSVVEELEPNAIKKNLKFAWSAPDKEFWVWADEQKLRQVVMNLIDNAIKYTQQGSVSVSLEHKGEQAIMAVQDTGMGMHPSESERLFEKFVRGAEASHYHTEGAGVGLYVAKKLIEEHQGRIWATSPGDGLGSTFFIELPEYKEK